MEEKLIKKITAFLKLSSLINGKKMALKAVLNNKKVHFSVSEKIITEINELRKGMPLLTKEEYLSLPVHIKQRILTLKVCPCCGYNIVTMALVYNKVTNGNTNKITITVDENMTGCRKCTNEFSREVFDIN